MLPLSRQVQIATDIARGAAARLSGVEPPSYEDKEQSFDDLVARIQRTIDYMASLKRRIRSRGDARNHAAGARQPHKFTGANYLLQFATPKLFHAATAYGILRHNGVALGKADFFWAG